MDTEQNKTLFDIMSLLKEKVLTKEITLIPNDKTIICQYKDKNGNTYNDITLKNIGNYPTAHMVESILMVLESITIELQLPNMHVLFITSNRDKEAYAIYKEFLQIATDNAKDYKNIDMGYTLLENIFN